MNAPFTILYARYSSIINDECDSFEDAMSRLNYIEDEGFGCSVAIIDNSTKSMVHYNEFVGEEDAQKNVDEFLSATE